MEPFRKVGLHLGCAFTTLFRNFSCQVERFICIVGIDAIAPNTASQLPHLSIPEVRPNASEEGNCKITGPFGVLFFDMWACLEKVDTNLGYFDVV